METTQEEKKMYFKVGETTWSDNKSANKEDFKFKKDAFLKLQQGDNIIRVITMPQQFYAHKIKVHQDERGWGSRVYCAAPGQQPCEACKYGKPSKRWLIGVIDRRTGTSKILDLNYFAFKGIQGLANSKWGNPEKYDLNLKFDPNAETPATMYHCIPELPEPLSATDQKIIDDFDKNDLLRRIQPPTSEQVAKRILKLKEDFYAKNPGAPKERELHSAVVASTATTNGVATKSPQEEDEEFPDYEESEENPF